MTMLLVALAVAFVLSVLPAYDIPGLKRTKLVLWHANATIPEDRPVFRDCQ